MANPRVFISSTCYDLSEVRDSLISFFQNFGFECILSERGDVFYHPDLHTHDSCIGEISNCQIFVLIIGGRFGGAYKKERRSITNAEYAAARNLDIPTFTFIKQDVLNDHNVWQKNKKKVFSDEIEYPSLEKQEHAKDIFEFIDTVRLGGEGNSFFGFSLAKDIHEKLRKQLAGMFFDFLTNRKISKQIENTNRSIADLSAASSKIEELVKQIYRQVDTNNAEKSILDINAESDAEEFFLRISSRISKKRFIHPRQIPQLVDSNEESWCDFLTCIDGFVLVEDLTSDDGSSTDIIGYDPNKKIVATISGDITEEDDIENGEFERFYEAFRLLTKEQRQKVLKKFQAVRAPSPQHES